jgi:transcriptional regulator with XRE-family HTH domain
MNRPSANLGIILRENREKKGLILLDVANKLGTSVQYVCDVEHGRKRMTYKLLKPWSKLIQVDPKDVLAFMVSEELDEAERQTGVRLGLREVFQSQNPS